jgi:hypothetical protein
MKRQIPGRHRKSRNADHDLEGSFLVRVGYFNYSWHPQKPCCLVRFVALEPQEFCSRHISGHLDCTPKALRRLNWFLHDFGYDVDLLGRDEVDEKAVIGLKGVVRTSQKTLAERSVLNLDGLSHEDEWVAGTAISQAEPGQFTSDSRIPFPQNGGVRCSHPGPCPNYQELIVTNLVRRPGASALDRLDELLD